MINNLKTNFVEFRKLSITAVSLFAVSVIIICIMGNILPGGDSELLLLFIPVSVGLIFLYVSFLAFYSKRYLLASIVVFEFLFIVLLTLSGVYSFVQMRNKPYYEEQSAIDLMKLYFIDDVYDHYQWMEKAKELANGVFDEKMQPREFFLDYAGFLKDGNAPFLVYSPINCPPEFNKIAERFVYLRRERQRIFAGIADRIDVGTDWADLGKYIIIEDELQNLEKLDAEKSELTERYVSLYNERYPGQKLEVPDEPFGKNHTPEWELVKAFSRKVCLEVVVIYLENNKDESFNSVLHDEQSTLFEIHSGFEKSCINKVEALEGINFGLCLEKLKKTVLDLAVIERETAKIWGKLKNGSKGMSREAFKENDTLQDLVSKMNEKTDIIVLKFEKVKTIYESEFGELDNDLFKTVKPEGAEDADN